MQQVQTRVEDERLQKNMDPTNYHTGLSMREAVEKARYNSKKI